MRMKDDFYYQRKEELKEDLLSLLFNQENFPNVYLVMHTIYKFVNDCVAEGCIKASVDKYWDCYHMTVSIDRYLMRMYISQNYIYMNNKKLSFSEFINLLMDVLD